MHAAGIIERAPTKGACTATRAHIARVASQLRNETMCFAVPNNRCRPATRKTLWTVSRGSIKTGGETLLQAYKNFKHELRYRREIQQTITPSRRVSLFGGKWLYEVQIRKARYVWMTHRPTDSRCWRAVEIECCVPDRDMLGTALGQIDMLRQRVTVKSDGSISAPDGYVGAEIVVCAPAEDIAACVRKVCDVLQTHNAQINITCGLHVHLDQRDATPEMVRERYTRLVAAQQLLMRFVSDSRKDNRYCRPSPRQWSTTTRYRVVNAVAYNTHRTLEVRVHQGTTSADKIVHWLTLLDAIVSSAYTPQRQIRSTAKWLARYDVPQATIDYYLARMTQLGRHDAPPRTRTARVSDTNAQAQTSA